MIYVGMAEYEFVDKLVADIRHVKLLLLLAYLGIEAHMQQHVAQFLADIRLVVLEQGVAQFECLFYGVGSKRLVGLLAVPRTFLAQLVEHIQQTSESLEFFFSCMHSIYIY